MLSGEYLVLHGAKALALPLRKGQAMEVKFSPGAERNIIWTASDPDGLWFAAELTYDTGLTVMCSSNPEISGKLTALLTAAESLNPEFLSLRGNYFINNKMTFLRNWGWGSSSTLISNVAWWANVDPYQLNRLISAGSGYDIACARSSSPLFFKLGYEKPEVEEINFQPAFHEHLAFVYLGRKQNTSAEISRHLASTEPSESEIDRIGEITSLLAGTNDQGTFNGLIDEHEKIISSILRRSPVKELEFPGFVGSIKSLGAWGGDFVLASSPQKFETTSGYFKDRGYPLSFRWKELIS